MATKQLERKKVSPADEPSAEWGWHGESPKFVHAYGIIAALALLIMNIGNHKGHVEDIYLVLFALGIIGLVVWDIRRRKTSWRQ